MYTHSQAANEGSTRRNYGKTGTGQKGTGSAARISVAVALASLEVEAFATGGLDGLQPAKDHRSCQWYQYRYHWPMVVHYAGFGFFLAAFILSFASLAAASSSRRFCSRCRFRILSASARKFT